MERVHLFLIIKRVNMIYIKKYNNNYHELICNNKDALRLIKKHFTASKLIFENRKPKTISICFLYKDRFLPCGLFNDLIDCLENNNIQFNVDPDFEPVNNINKEKLYKSFESYHLSQTLTEYQKETVYLCLKDKRKLILSPTSSGKSMIIFLTCMSYLSMKEENKKIVIIVPSITLVNQMYFDFKDYLKNTRIDISKYMDRRGGSNKEEFTKNILVTTWQSLQNEKPAFLKQFGMVIYDEVHSSKALVSKNIIEKTIAPYRIGLTGTLANEDDELSELTIKGLFGEIYIATSYQELLELEFVTPMEIRSIILNHKNKSKMTYLEEKKYISEDQRRIKIINNIVNKSTGNTLLLFNTIEYGRKLLAEISKSKKCYYIDGSVSGKEREEIRQKLEKENGCVLVASFATVGTGFSVRNIHNVIFGESRKSRISVIQAIGRGIRKSNNKDIVYIYDICDYINYYDRPSYSYTHYKKRKKYYNDYGYPFKEITLDLM